MVTTGEQPFPSVRVDDLEIVFPGSLMGRGRGRAKSAAFLVCFSLACTAPRLLADKKKQASFNADDSRRALHALNRLTFGPRPGEVQQVMAIGVERWIELQLHPEKIDDSAINARLEPLRTVRMNSREIAEDFPGPQAIHQVMDGKKSMPSDPARQAIYQVQLARLEARKEGRTEAGRNTAAAVKSDKSSAMAANTRISADASADAGSEMTAAVPRALPTPEEEEQARRREEQLYSDLGVQQEVQQLASLPPDERFKKVLGMSLNAQVAFAESLRGGKGQEFLEGLNSEQKETVLAMNNPEMVVMSELMQAKLLRAIYSQRQLEEVMTDFWFNHFNVFLEKGLDRMLVTSYERDVIRPHALGKFEDLLVATAKSPAMLFYLDNFMSVGPNSLLALGLPARPYRHGPYGERYPPQRARPNPGKRPSGLNENYARELLELHTLSVNGGYSEHDVTEVAKVFTGWTIDHPAEGGSFKFDPRMHEPGTKSLLGHKIKPKGEGEGLEVLHRLATNPQTAHFISLKLAQRFVSDNPPPALVDRMAKTFLKKKGDICEVLKALFQAQEFWDDTTYRAKVKTPLEFVASAVRATGAEIDDALPLTRQLYTMGMPLYGAQPPTGYSMKAEAWVSSATLLNRMNFALALTRGNIKGVKVDSVQLAGENPPQDASATLLRLEANLIQSGVSKQTHDSIAAQIGMSGQNGPERSESKAGRPFDVSTTAGLLLGSPEFQRR